MLFVAAFLGNANICLALFQAMLLMHKIGTEGSSGNLR
jgi:hypothetical protein